ncbi:hypothetical protein H4S06_004907 [Coemansia sp. BCRC 34490]|nr:hypothetical protein H4S06_004907 [Coemansia sp. BCRC 34490]
MTLRIMATNVADVVPIAAQWNAPGPWTENAVPEHSCAVRVTRAICGPRNRTNVCSPAPSPIDDNTPRKIQ